MEMEFALLTNQQCFRPTKDMIYLRRPEQPLQLHALVRREAIEIINVSSETNQTTVKRR